MVVGSGVSFVGNATVNNTLTIPINTLAGNSFQVFTAANNMASVRIIAGDPANKGTHTVIELQRDAADFTFSYVGTMSVQGPQ